MDVTARVDNGDVVFDIPWSDANGLLGFAVAEEDGNRLWEVRLPYEKGHQIVYGELPTGGNMKATQVIPADGSSPPDIKNQKVRIWVEYQYDYKLSAISGSFEKTLQIPGS